MSSRRAHAVRVEILLRAGLWAALLAVVAYTRTDPDLWGHVRFGVDILRDRMLQVADPYSFTSDRPWINHEWAAETLCALAFSFFGAPGLVLLKLLVVGATLVLVNVALRADAIVISSRRDLICGFAVIATVQQAHHVRPQLFSLLLFAVLLSCLMSSTVLNRRIGLLIVPPVFALWANLHGGWIVGGAVLALWLVGTVVENPAERREPVVLLFVGIASLLATLVNPYGLGLWRFLYETVGLGRADITDWQPVYALDPSVWGLWIIVAIAATVGFARERRALDARRVLVVVVLAVGSFFVNRLIGFFALSVAMLLGAAVAGTLQADPATKTTPVARRVGFVLSAFMISGGLLAIVINVSCIPIDRRTAPEPDAVAVLRNQIGGSRLLVWFDWGEYAIWHLAPKMQVSIDGRRETVYSASLQNRHLRFFFDAPGGANLPREIGADYVWIPVRLPAAARLTAANWSVLYQGSESIIFARPGLHVSRPPTDMSAAGLKRCFPSQ